MAEIKCGSKTSRCRNGNQFKEFGSRTTEKSATIGQSIGDPTERKIPQIVFQKSKQIYYWNVCLM